MNCPTPTMDQHPHVTVTILVAPHYLHEAKPPGDLRDTRHGC